MLKSWKDVTMIDLKKGDIVRVKLDAYSGSAGKLHNGRRCKIVEMYGGDVVVRSIDEAEPPLYNTYHSPHKLEMKK